MIIDEDNNEEWEDMRNKAKQITNLLIELDREFIIEIWDSAKGMSIITNAEDEDNNKNYKLRFNLFLSGGFNFSVEELKGETK